MKKSSILDYFKSQNDVTKVACPACNALVMKSKLNDHLDSACSSSLSSLNNAKINYNDLKSQKSSSSGENYASSLKVSHLTSKKLNLKNQRAKKPCSSKKSSPQISAHDSDSDVIILDEIPSTVNGIKSPQKNEAGIISHNTVNSDFSALITPSEKSNKQDEAIKPQKKLTPASSKNNLKRSLTFSSSSRRSKIKRSTTSIDEEKFIKDTDSNEQSLHKQEIIIPMKTKSKTKSFPLNVESKTIKNVGKKDKINEVSNSSKEKIVDDKIDDVCHSPDKEKIEKNSICKDENQEKKDLIEAQHCLEDGSAFSELSDNNEVKEKKYAPYYIANFKFILENVLNDKDNKILFNEEDLSFVSDFNSLTEASQKIYVRLFQRKYKWLRIDKIKYPEITSDSLACLEELNKAGLSDSGSVDIDLETALNLLSLPEAKNVAKHFNFSSGKNKEEIKAMLVKHSKQHKSVFFMNGANGIAKMMLKKVRQVIGPCYRLSLLPKKLFTRILMLFNLTLLSEDDDDSAAGGQQQQLLTLLQVNKGELKFPDYKRTKDAIIFADRDELIRYEEARQLETDIFIAAERKQYEEAKQLFLEAKEEFEDQCTKSFLDRALSLPVFLKRYTSFHVYIRCMTQGVEILQKLREYKEAVALLRKLLKQKEFCQDYKGRWYDRLALNLEQHLKKPQEALKEIQHALDDNNVRKGHRYSLLIRALRITKSLDDEDELKKKLSREADVIEAPKVIIKGRLCPRSILGRRHVFISSSSVCSNDEDVTVLGVEQLTLEHYKEEGYPEGIHGEGSTFISLYALLFWDIIYDGNIPDVFISPYQTHPMDLNSDQFFKNREEQIISHLKTIKHSTNEELKEIVKTTWENNHGKASLVSWDRFTDLEYVQGLVCCFGNQILSGICERIAKDFRFTRSGVPDLVVWNPESLKVKIVEVKGPGDKLSSKQILWLDYLIRIGADAEVCLVEAVASKKLRKEKSDVTE